MNTSSLGDRAHDAERAEMIRREEALERWRTPMQEQADRAAALASRTPEAKKEDLPAVASGGSYL